MQAANEVMPQLDLAAVFTLLFVTLGPVKLLGPFEQATLNVDGGLLKRLALLTFAVGTVAALAGGFVGRLLLGSWQISQPAITLAGAIIFFLVGLRLVLEPYSAGHANPQLSPKLMRAVFQLAFPAVVTPYGLAAVIALLASSSGVERTIWIVAMLVAIMVMNLLSMLYIRHIMGTVTVVVLQIFGAVLAVLQVAVAVQLMLRGLRQLAVVQ